MGYEPKPSKNEKESIPKLKEEDRQVVLPIIIKILLSKLIKKKGSINQKSIYARRSIIY